MEYTALCLAQPSPAGPLCCLGSFSLHPFLWPLTWRGGEVRFPFWVLCPCVCHITSSASALSAHSRLFRTDVTSLNIAAAFTLASGLVMRVSTRTSTRLSLPHILWPCSYCCGGDFAVALTLLSNPSARPMKMIVLSNRTARISFPRLRVLQHCGMNSGS